MGRFSFVLVCLLDVKSALAFAPPVSRLSQDVVQARPSALQMTTDSGAKDPVKVGVIGCGRIGIVHLGAINKAPGVVPIVVSNPTISKAEDAAKTFGVSKFTSDAMEVIEDPE
eukprot:CAMPEP_0172550634 /NCGR_PEP_ID=MMETSP1067-20121228/31005_1 /TAXON_ID=265564 ORGANISM="Thalassiosira punctigera, Strain Tpunct2005C2" /NCGR_SAMPLE_ID=MMETSP1067 /ASSEMBLY_ACC=CAM_ASM_000444 /LENGTH=112 /DNA_ID=CAMNT_0013338261 /DNA_START=117 /DNA_END=452 /DNA_ORIENTATION=+